MTKYKKLFSAGRIAGIKLKNRIVMAPLAMGVAEKDQTVGDAFLEYLLERARGGVGMIILENTRVDDEHGVAAQCQAAVSRDEHIAPLRRAVDALHAEGVAVLTQLHHPGRETFSNLNSNEPVWSSSSRKCGVCNQETHEMTTQEVEQVIAKFVRGAQRSQQAGCDGVELHGAHGYLISQFLSPYTNKRTDRFGGSFDARLTFVKEILDGIRKECGKKFPVGIRLTVDELLTPDCGEYLTLADGVKVCERLEEWGISYINVSNGIYESFNSLSEPMTYPQGCRTERIRAIRNAVKLPLIAVNTVKEPQYAEKMLCDDLVDFVGLGRAVVADPEWAKKAYEGREDEINRCISCTFCFETLVSDTIGGIGPVKCAVNARAAREKKYGEFKKNGGGKKVLVAGAGVSGLEAARVLAERGFTPVVYEKENVSGGQINLADKPPRKEKIDWIVQYETGALSRAGVEIKYSTPLTPQIIAEQKPYAVFVATGASDIRPKSVPGAQLSNVLTVSEVLGGKAQLGGKKVLVVGSGATGLEVAEFLCEQGCDVSIAEMLDSIGKGVYVQHYLDAMDKLSKFKVEYLPSHKLCEVKADSALLHNLVTDKDVSVACDFVALCLGVKSENALAEQAKTVCDKVVVIGDARTPGRIEGAVRSAFEAAFYLE